MRQGFEMRLPRLAELNAAGSLRHSIEEYRTRLQYEIDVIKRMQYPGYFLIVWDFIRYAREQGIPVGPGRGSAAGSLVAYCLKITDVDPLQFDLLFERFLNPERISLPDIDIDFCERRRGEVIDYVTRKYGRENVAQIITFGTMKAKAVVRDVGRVMDMSYADVDKVAKQIPAALDMTLDKARRREPDPPRHGAERRPGPGSPGHRAAPRGDGPPRLGARRRAWSSRPRPVTEFAPLYKGSRDEITTQWGMKEIERIGLLKMDFLGLSTLTLVHDALEQIEATTGTRLVMEDLPLTDAKTFDLFCEGQTLGVFQFESSGMRQILRQAKPRKFEDLIALNALYRPGPIKGGHDRRLHQPQARARRGPLRAAAARADPRRDLRRHGLPGAGHARRERAGRILARPGRPAAQGDGEEEHRADEGAAREVHRRARPGAASTRRRRRACST